jgi:hypothetical protein
LDHPKYPRHHHHIKIVAHTNDQNKIARRNLRKLFSLELYLPKGIKYASDLELEEASSASERWAISCGALVVISVVVELIIARLDPPYDIFLYLSIWPDAAIALGIVGEVACGMWDGRIQTEQRRRSNEKLGIAEKVAGEAHARAAESELKLMQLRKLVGHRSVNIETLKKELEGKPKSRVAIWYLPDSSDGHWLAHQLSGGLANAGWSPERPIPIPDLDAQVVEKIMPGVPLLLPILRTNPRSVNAGGQPSGITVVGDNAIVDVSDFKSDTPFNALRMALVRSTGSNIYSGVSQFSPVPTGTLRVVIAEKPDPMFPDAPAARTGDER